MKIWYDENVEKKKFEKRQSKRDVDLEDRAYIYGDCSLLELVWNNLISNAIKFTDQGGMISICQESEEDYVRISVRDTGCGMDENLPAFYEKKKPGKETKTVLRLKRNRKIVNKMELTRLQRNFEACMAEIASLEKSKTSAATVYALIVALIGTAFMAGSTFAVTAQTPQILLCILLAVPGFIGWILPVFVYRRTVRKKTKELNPLIEEKYDEIYELCEKGSKLLY